MCLLFVLCMLCAEHWSTPGQLPCCLHVVLVVLACHSLITVDQFDQLSTLCALRAHRLVALGVCSLG
jgi:hypothetical protein